MYPYTYSLLRYVHDPSAGETVNVGVVLLSEDVRFLGAKCHKTVGRLTKVFPDIDRQGFREMTNFVEVQAKKLAKQYREQMTLEKCSSVKQVTTKILHQDDSAFQWSEVRSGVASNPEAALEKIYDRMVAKYDEPAAARKKSDEDVWRPFRLELEERQVLKHFHKKTIRSRDDTLEVTQAWKNGIWHCLEPLSFDLSGEDHIKEKAYRWLGHLVNVENASEKFKLYFLLGKPRDKKLSPAFKSAVNILKNPLVRWSQKIGQLFKVYSTI